jgi:hypothetical protein
MCWQSFRKPVKKIAHKNINVLKILFFDDSNNSIISYFYNFKYEENVIYFEKIDDYFIVDKYDDVLYRPRYLLYRINKGFHSYKNIKFEFRFPLLFAYNNNGNFLERYNINTEMRVALCSIPEGSEYYENENGEIVSNSIIINKVISIEDYVLDQGRILFSIEEES